jgi:hypothetical protein
VVLRGAMRTSDGPGRMGAMLERFFGARIGSRRWIVLTNSRLLVLRGRDPASYGTDDWFDVSLDRTGIKASMPFMEGSLVVVAIVSRKGPATLLLPEASYREAVRFARALGAEERGPGRQGRQGKSTSG